VLIILFILNSCSTLRELISFTKCEFRLKSVEKVSLAGVNMKNKQSLSDFGFGDLTSVTQSVIRGNIPLKFSVNLEAKNPNSQTAAIDKIEWIAYVDDSEIVRGMLNERITVPANNGQTDIPLHFQIDLEKISNSSTAKSLVNLALSFTNLGDYNSRLTLKIKPTVTIAAFAIDYPGYIQIEKTFSSGN